LFWFVAPHFGIKQLQNQFINSVAPAGAGCGVSVMPPVNEQLKSERILDELKLRQRTKDIVAVEEERVKVVIFICGENRYAFYGTDIREILPACDISWVPCLPDYLPGLINVRGDIESVIDIRHFLGEEKAGHGSCLVAMAVRGDFHSGIMIDAIDDVVDIPLSTIHPPLATLSGAARDLAIGEIEYRDGMVTLLDIEKLATKISL
jgi:purine-binding chemotaxis protein CheW